MPRSRASAEKSANGSMKTDCAGVLSRKADWPYHSTCMLLLGSGWGEYRRRCGRVCLRRSLVAVVATAPHQRRGRGDEARDDRERERLMQAGPERTGNQMGKERLAGQHRAVVEADRGEGLR